MNAHERSPIPQGIYLGRILAGETHPDVVYFLAMTFHGRDAVKIGTSTRLKARIGSLSYVAEMEDVLLLMPGGHDVETAYHNRFRKYQIKPYAELFWREGELATFLCMAPPVSYASAFAAHIRRTLTRNPRAKRERRYKPRSGRSPRTASAQNVAPAPQPDVPSQTSITADPRGVQVSLSEAVSGGHVPGATLRALQMDRHRSHKGELSPGLVFPQPAGMRGEKTELFWSSELAEFNTARRGNHVSR